MRIHHPGYVREGEYERIHLPGYVGEGEHEAHIPPWVWEREHGAHIPPWVWEGGSMVHIHLPGCVGRGEHGAHTASLGVWRIVTTLRILPFPTVIHGDSTVCYPIVGYSHR